MNVQKIVSTCELYGPDKTCGDYYNCCSCGSTDADLQSCGCRYCFDCNACEVCKGDE